LDSGLRTYHHIDPKHLTKAKKRPGLVRLWGSDRPHQGWSR